MSAGITFWIDYIFHSNQVRNLRISMSGNHRKIYETRFGKVTLVRHSLLNLFIHLSSRKILLSTSFNYKITAANYLELYLNCQLHSKQVHAKSSSEGHKVHLQGYEYHRSVHKRRLVTMRPHSSPPGGPMTPKNGPLGFCQYNRRSCPKEATASWQHLVTAALKCGDKQRK